MWLHLFAFDHHVLEMRTNTTVREPVGSPHGDADRVELTEMCGAFDRCAA